MALAASPVARPGLEAQSLLGRAAHLSQPLRAEVGCRMSQDERSEAAPPADGPSSNSSSVMSRAQRRSSSRVSATLA